MVLRGGVSWPVMVLQRTGCDSGAVAGSLTAFADSYENTIDWAIFEISFATEETHLPISAFLSACLLGEWSFVCILPFPNVRWT